MTWLRALTKLSAQNTLFNYMRWGKLFQQKYFNETDSGRGTNWITELQRMWSWRYSFIHVLFKETEQWNSSYSVLSTYLYLCQLKIDLKYTIFVDLESILLSFYFCANIADMKPFLSSLICEEHKKYLQLLSFITEKISKNLPIISIKSWHSLWKQWRLIKSCL